MYDRKSLLWDAKGYAETYHLKYELISDMDVPTEGLAFDPNMIDSVRNDSQHAIIAWDMSSLDASPGTELSTSYSKSIF